MAHDTQVRGKISELVAAQALIENGWEVTDPVVDEVYDLVARDPVNGEWATFQVKTIRKRSDRNNELVLYATKGNGTPYTKEDCDYLIGVLDNDVYMMETRGLREYWASEQSAQKRWVRLSGEVQSED